MKLLPLFLMLGAAAAPGADRQIAVIVANGAYARNPLPQSTRIGVEMQSAFAGLGFETHLLANATMPEIQQTVGQLAHRVTRHDTVIVYFHGYAVRGVDDNLLLPIDTLEEPDGNVTGYATTYLFKHLGRARTVVVIVDPAGDSPFGQRKNGPGLTLPRVGDNQIFVLSTKPGTVPVGNPEIFPRALRNALQRAPIRWDPFFQAIGKEMNDHTNGRRLLGGRSTFFDLRANGIARQPQPAAAGPTTWNEAKALHREVPHRIAVRVGQRGANRHHAMKQLEADRAQFTEERYQAERARLEAIFADTTGDPSPALVAQASTLPFRGPCAAEWVRYEASRQLLTLHVAHADRQFTVSPGDAQSLQPRAALLHCEGAFSPESVRVSDPEGKIELVELPWPEPNPRGITMPRPTVKPEPDFAEEARLAGVQKATVVVSLLVDESGVPSAIRIKQAAGFGLDQQAVKAVRRWRFTPAMKDGQPVPAAVSIHVEFRHL